MGDDVVYYLMFFNDGMCYLPRSLLLLSPAGFGGTPILRWIERCRAPHGPPGQVGKLAQSSQPTCKQRVSPSPIPTM